MTGMAPNPIDGAGVAVVDATPRNQWNVSSHLSSYRGGAALLAVTVAVLWFVYSNPPSWQWIRDTWKWFALEGSVVTLRWLIALLPATIILNHLIYLLSSRRNQFREAFGRLYSLEKLEELYFAYLPLTVRYVLPALVVTVACSTAVAAVMNPERYLPWLYVPTQSAAADANDAQAASNANTTEVATHWPPGWAGQTLRGAAFGFVGAYVYLLLLLTDRARQRDITTGIAVWAAVLPILGPIVGGVAALLLVSGAGDSSSFSRDAVFFVAGMLPRQFAGFVQSGVRKMFQGGSATALCTQPLTMLRGVGPEVEARLQEEGIYDVSSLAYAPMHLLMRATTYGARQITDWIDEALLIATLPEHWELLEKVGVTGALDLSWYESHQDAIPALAQKIELSPQLLGNVIERLSQDAQVRDLQLLYWTGIGSGKLARDAQPPNPDPPEPKADEPKADEPKADAPAPGTILDYVIQHELQQDARDRLVAEVQKIQGVRAATATADDLAIAIDPSTRDAVVAELAKKQELRPK